MSVRSRQIFALGVAAIFAGETLLGLAHRVAEQHARCPEHGEVIHVGEPEDEPGLARREGPAEDPGHGRVRGTGMSAADDHDHCFALASARERLGGGTASKPVPVAPPVAAPPPEAGERRASALSVYRIAPKNSPPA